MAMDPLSMKSVLDRVELLEKSYQEERLAVRRYATSRSCGPQPLGGALSVAQPKTQNNVVPKEREIANISF